MAVAVSRASFLRGSFLKEIRPPRPPWAVQDDAFGSSCDRCGECLSACPEGILRRGRGGYPEVDFARGECTFCAACVEVCPTGALARDACRDRPPWELKAHVDGACLARRGVACRVCEEHCEARAIRFRLAPRGSLDPRVDPGLCTGCGGCYRSCPAEAIGMEAPAQ